MDQLKIIYDETSILALPIIILGFEKNIPITNIKIREAPNEHYPCRLIGTTVDLFSSNAIISYLLNVDPLNSAIDSFLSWETSVLQYHLWKVIRSLALLNLPVYSVDSEELKNVLEQIQSYFLECPPSGTTVISRISNLLIWSDLLPLFWAQSPLSVEYRKAFPKLTVWFDSLLENSSVRSALTLLKLMIGKTVNHKRNNQQLQKLLENSKKFSQLATANKEVKFKSIMDDLAKMSSLVSGNSAAPTAKQQASFGLIGSSTATPIAVVHASPSDCTTTSASPQQIVAALNAFSKHPLPLSDTSTESISKLPQSTADGKTRNILITAALPYVNNVPHLGNIIGSVLSADVFARFCRLLPNRNVLFIGGTDEYGTATETKAMQEGLSPRQICDKYYAIHRRVYEWFQISFEHFGRTTTELHQQILEEIFGNLHASGFILPDQLDQLYCDACARWLADRYVEGVCAFCGFEDARGDQCDKCSKLINAATELLHPRCKMCAASPRVRTSQHLFLDLPRLHSAVAEHISRMTQPSGDGGENVWTKSALAITNSWLNDATPVARAEGEKDPTLSKLKPRCITRDLKWGVKVPLAGYEEKVFYVWFDAPVGYISITANYFLENHNRMLEAKPQNKTAVKTKTEANQVWPLDGWRRWWMNGKPQVKDDSKGKERKRKDEGEEQHVELYHFLGKDNVPFHSVVFPATLIGSGQGWTLVQHIVAVEYLNYESEKFSKSRGVGVFGEDCRETGIPADVWRFYLLAVRPESQDSSFVWDDFQTRVNSELLANLGNFVNRAFSFIDKYFQGRMPELEHHSGPFTEIQSKQDRELNDVLLDISRCTANYLVQMEKTKMREALTSVLELGRIGNKFVQNQRPWVPIKSVHTRHKAAMTVTVAANLACLIGQVLQPFMPNTSQMIWEQCNAPASSRRISATVESPHLLRLLPEGNQLGKIYPLFHEIDSAFVKKMKEKFSAGNTFD